MKNDLLNALLMILIIAPPCNTTAANTLITKVHVEFHKKCQKICVAFEVPLKVNWWACKFPYEEVPNLLILERKTDNVISSVETEVSKYVQATDLPILDSDSDLDMDDNICEAGNDFY